MSCVGSGWVGGIHLNKKVFSAGDVTWVDFDGAVKTVGTTANADDSRVLLSAIPSGAVLCVQGVNIPFVEGRKKISDDFLKRVTAINPTHKDPVLGFLTLAAANLPKGVGETGAHSRSVMKSFVAELNRPLHEVDVVIGDYLGKGATRDYRAFVGLDPDAARLAIAKLSSVADVKSRLNGREGTTTLGKDEAWVLFVKLFPEWETSLPSGETGLPTQDQLAQLRADSNPKIVELYKVFEDEPGHKVSSVTVTANGVTERLYPDEVRVALSLRAPGLSRAAEALGKVLDANGSQGAGVHGAHHLADIVKNVSECANTAVNSAKDHGQWVFHPVFTKVADLKKDTLRLLEKAVENEGKGPSGAALVALALGPGALRGTDTRTIGGPPSPTYLWAAKRLIETAEAAWVLDQKGPTIEERLGVSRETVKEWRVYVQALA